MDILLDRIQTLETQIQKLLVKDEVRMAISILLEFCAEYSNTEEKKNELIIQSASLTRILKSYRNDLIDWELMSKHKSKVIFVVLGITSDIKKEIVYQADNDSIPPRLRFGLEGFNGGGFSNNRYYYHETLTDPHLSNYKDDIFEDLEFLFLNLREKGYKSLL